jgi:hypothetical protein
MNDEKTQTTAARIIQAASEEVGEAAIRTAARQLMKLVREPTVALLSRGDGALGKNVALALNTPMGGMMLNGAVAGLLTAMLSSGKIPATQTSVVNRIARELRVSCLAEGGDMLADILMAPLREVLSATIQGLPPATPELEGQSAPTTFDAQADASYVANP